MQEKIQTTLRESVGLAQNPNGTENLKVPPFQDGKLVVYIGRSKVAGYTTAHCKYLETQWLLTVKF